MNTNASTAEQAIAWFVRSREGELSAAERQQLVEWLIESPRNVREYLDTAKTWGALQSDISWPKDSREDLLRIVSEAAQSTDAVPLACAARVQETRPLHRTAYFPEKRFHRRLLYGMAASVLALMSISLGWFWYAKPAAYETARGEQRYIVLPDGSSVQLNTLTKLVVRFDERRRLIELPQGEALFRVARDSARPFEVTTSHARVRALGTQFNVYNRRQGTRVAVIEGKVRIVSAAKNVQTAASASFLDLNPQQAVDVDVHGRVAAILSVKQTHPGDRTESDSGGIDPEIAWVRRRIVLDGDPVATAVEEFNRYNVKQILIDDPALAGLRITGVFNADEPAALVKYLREIRPLEVTETDGELHVHR